MLFNYFPTYKFNITDSLIGLLGGNSFLGMDLPTECHAAFALFFWFRRASCRSYLAYQEVSLDAILEATPSASVLQFTAWALAEKSKGYDLKSAYSQKSYHKII